LENPGVVPTKLLDRRKWKRLFPDVPFNGKWYISEIKYNMFYGGSSIKNTEIRAVNMKKGKKVKTTIYINRRPTREETKKALDEEEEKEWVQ